MQFDKKGNNPLLAAGFLFKGLKLLGKPELRSFVIIPILINVVLYVSAFIVAYVYFSTWIEQIIPGWLHWLSWILWPLFFISFFIATFFTFTVAANLLASPFYGKLAARTLAVAGSELPPIAEPPLSQVLLAELKRLGYLAARAIPLLILTVIPGLNIVAPVLWAIFGAWGLAMEYLAYPLENQGVLFSEQKTLLKNINLGALGFGGIGVLALSVPVLNILVGPAAVIGATLYCDEIKQD